jgi:lysozyme family protein
MSDQLDAAMAYTLSQEGVWYDGSDPRDPNPTMYGVIQKNYDVYRDLKHMPRQSVRLIAHDEVRNIYATYWYGTCDAVAETHPLTARSLFDMAVNGGASTARKILQRALGAANDSDLGTLGPMTLAALARVESDRLLALWVSMERIRYYDTVAESPRLRPNLKSWVGRTVDFYNRFIRV